MRAERNLSRWGLEKNFNLGEDQNQFFPNIIIVFYKNLGEDRSSNSHQFRPHWWFLLHCIFAKYFSTRYYTYISFLHSRWMSIRWLVPEYGFHAKVQFIYPSVFWDSMLKPNLFPQLFHCYLGISLCLKKRFQVSRCHIKALISILIEW